MQKIKFGTVAPASISTTSGCPRPASTRPCHEMGIDSYTLYPAVPARRGGCWNEAFAFGGRGILSPDPHCEHFAATRP